MVRGNADNATESTNIGTMIAKTHKDNTHSPRSKNINHSAANRHFDLL